jgi:NAD+ synthase (glutamine-hydrolysing)
MAPLKVSGAIYNTAIVIHRGRVIGVVPKSYLPNYREFYEKRHFAFGEDAIATTARVAGQIAPFGTDLIFAASDIDDLVIHFEICEDVWAAIPPSTYAAFANATVLCNLSASNITIGKAEERNLLCAAQSHRCCAAYLYSAAGAGDSTTDLAWDGHLAVFELGVKLAESQRFQQTSTLLIADIDIERLAQERMRMGTFRDNAARHREKAGAFRTISFEANVASTRVPLKRAIGRFPYVPSDAQRLDQDCYEAYNIQVHGITKRLEAVRLEKAVIGVSGGLDSAQALLVTASAFDRLKRPRSNNARIRDQRRHQVQRVEAHAGAGRRCA